MKALLLGFCVSVPFGPVAILVIQNSISKGRRSGFVTGLGATIVDSTWATVSVFAIGYAQAMLQDHGSLILSIGGGVLIFLGISMIFANPFRRLDRKEQKLQDKVSPRDFLKSSLHLSEYIRFAITRKNQSVWIAQRNGRTKDGIDQTAPGIIKMFQMSYPEDRIAALEQLHIVPVTVSYEWEPCDIHKTLELYESGFGVYTKMPQEDLNSILSGIVAPKGRVHFHIGKMIQREDLLPFNNQVNSKFNRDVAELLDRRICSEYRLTPNNYIAHDLLYGQSIYRDMYTVEQKDTFMHRLASFEKYENCNQDRMREIFLGIYANPVDSYIKAKAQIAEE